MKKLGFNSVLLIVAACLSFTACKKDESSNPAPGIKDNKDGQAIAAFMRKNGPQFEVFSIEATRGGTFTSTKGVKYKIPANVFVKKDGSAVTGAVSVSVKEITEASGMILGDKPTVTNNGEILISYGEFFVRAQQGGVDLELKKDSAVGVQVPFRQANGAGIKEVALWSGDSAVTITNSGHDYQNNPVTLTTQGYVNKGLDWTLKPSEYAFFNSTNSSLDFKLNTLFQWVNCDVLYSVPGTKITLLAYFTNHFNNQTGQNYSGEEPSMLYFKPKGMNTVIKLYNVIMAPPAGFEGFLSYQNMIPVGIEGTFLAISSVNGVFYAEQKDVTVASPAGSANYSTVSFNLSQVTESQLLTLINQMSSK